MRFGVYRHGVLQYTAKALEYWYGSHNFELSWQQFRIIRSGIRSAFISPFHNEHSTDREIHMFEMIKKKREKRKKKKKKIDIQCE